MAASTWTARKRRAFLKTLAETGNVSGATRAAEVSRSHAYTLKAQDPEFAALWEEALGAAVDALEAEARHRAVDGVEQPHFHQGKVTGSVRKYSDALLMFLLRAHRPEKYRDRQIEGARTGDDDIEDAKDELEARLARLDPDDDAEAEDEAAPDAE